MKARITAEDALSKHIVDAAIEVHRTLGGPGLLERVYEEAMAWEFLHRGIKVERQKTLDIVYKGEKLATGLRLDMLVGDLVIVECKSLNQYSTIFETQALTYLRVTGLRLGFVINFGERLVKDGIKRVVNRLYE